jgi:hypothetical protein
MTPQELQEIEGRHKRESRRMRAEFLDLITAITNCAASRTVKGDGVRYLLKLVSLYKSVKNPRLIAEVRRLTAELEREK